MRRPTRQGCTLVAFVVALFVVGGREAAAQDGGQEVLVFKRQIDDAAPGADVTFLRTARPPQELGLIAVEPFEAARPVVNAPYTAEAVTEVTTRRASPQDADRRHVDV